MSGGNAILASLERADHHTATRKEPGIGRALRRLRTDQVLRREGDVMGLTTAVALLAALSAGDDSAPHSQLEVLAIVWGTTVGLALVHAFGVLVSVGRVRETTATYRPLELLMSQVAMASMVAVSASVVVMVTSTSLDRLGARITAGVFIGGLVGFESRTGGASRGRAVLLGVGVTVIAVAVAITKWFISK